MDDTGGLQMGFDEGEEVVTAETDEADAADADNEDTDIHVEWAGFI
jgi:hypothetical protein